MKNQRLLTTLLFALICFALPAWADNSKDDQPLPEEDNILGTWHGQYILDGILPEGEMKLVFDEDGTVIVFEGDEEEETGRYIHDKGKSKIAIYEGDNPADVEVEFTYSFVDDMLVLRVTEDFIGDEDVQIVFEMTRNIEGTKRHQKLRKEAEENGEGLGPRSRVKKEMQSITQMRGLHQSAVIYATGNKSNYPTSLGKMLPADLFIPQYVLTPWSEVKVPKGIDDWDDQKKIDWVNKNTGYVYLLAGKKEALDPKLVGLFELPRSTDQEKVRVLFEDNSVQAMAYAQADKLIKKQTGHTIKAWMKTTSPGTGKMVLPQKKEQAAQ